MDNKEKKKILSINNLEKYFVKSGNLVKVLDDINFDVYEKDFFGIIGESGSGKSTTGKCIIRLYDSTSGIINFDGKIINNKNFSNNDRKWLSKNMSMIFQDPMSSLNPKKTILSIIAEPLFINKVIKKDVNDLVQISLKINPYFQNLFQYQDYNLNNKYLISFYDKAINVFKTAKNEVVEYKLDEKNPKLLCMNFISNIIGYESSYKSLIPQIYEFNFLTKELIYYNNSKLEKKQIKAEESNYYEAKKMYLEQQKLLYAPDKYWDLKKSLAEIKSKLNELVNKIDKKFIVDKQNFIRATIQSLKSELNIYKQNKKLSTSLSDYKIFNVKILMIKEVLEVFINLNKSNSYLDGNELELFLKFINAKVQHKYRNVLQNSMLLKQIGEAIDKMTLDKNTDEDILNVLTSFKNLFFSITTDLENLYSTNRISEDQEVKLLLVKLNEEADYVKKEVQNKIDWYNKLISNMENEMKELKDNYLGSMEYMSNKRKIDEASIVLDRAKIRKDNLNEKNDEYFLTKIYPHIVAQKQLIKIKVKEFKQAQKSYILSLKKKKSQLCKFLNENKIDTKYWTEFLKREINSKINNISAINFELNTYLDEINIYKAIRTTNKYKINLYRKSLKTIITRQYVYKALNDVGLKNEHAYRYPHEFSGGQRQRIVIARALMMKPKLIIADEPISALDVSIQAQVINIMKRLSEDMGITFLFIAHDLSMVRYVSNRLIIMHKGRIVEKGDTKEIFKNPIHPYTKSLIKASPELGKIHVDLASFSTNLDYDSNYGKSSQIPKFYSVSDKFEHHVFATKDQIEKWVEK